MLVSNTFGWVIIIIIGVLALVAMGLLLTKLKANPNLYLLAIAIGMLAGFSAYCRTTCVVDVAQDGTIEIFMGFGSSEYTSTDGQKVSVSERSDGTDTYIINGTNRMMCLETIEYGESSFIFFDFGPSLILPHTTCETYSEPDYFPYETPPNAVSVTEGVDSDKKHWLRYGQ